MFFCVAPLRFSSPSIWYTDWMRFLLSSSPLAHTHAHVPRLLWPVPSPAVDLNWVTGWLWCYACTALLQPLHVLYTHTIVHTDGEIKADVFAYRTKRVSKHVDLYTRARRDRVRFESARTHGSRCSLPSKEMKRRETNDVHWISLSHWNKTAKCTWTWMHLLCVCGQINRVHM